MTEVPRSVPAGAHPAGTKPEGTSVGARLRAWLVRFRQGGQDSLWAKDEAWAEDRGFTSTRSPGGWSVTLVPSLRAAAP